MNTNADASTPLARRKKRAGANNDVKQNVHKRQKANEVHKFKLAMIPIAFLLRSLSRFVVRQCMN